MKKEVKEEAPKEEKNEQISFDDFTKDFKI